MRESLSLAQQRASVERGPIGPSWSPKFRKFGPVARLLWPRKTAAELAFRAHVTERAAKRWLAGTRKPSAIAVQAIVNEMLS